MFGLLMGEGPCGVVVVVVVVDIAVGGGVRHHHHRRRLVSSTLTRLRHARPKTRRKHMSLALERKRRLALVSGPGSLLGVVELGAGAGRSVLTFLEADEEYG